MRKSALHKWTRILWITFSPWKNGKRLPLNGNLEPLRDYCRKRTAETVVIDQPYPGSDRVMPRIEVYSEKRLVSVTTSSVFVQWLMPFLLIMNKEGTRLVFKLRDLLSILDWCMRDLKPYDILIGFESVNALAGVLLRRLGKVKRVVYYVSDYSPVRYRNPVMNAGYVWLDRLAAMHADYIWDVSLAMQPARVKAGLHLDASAPVIRVPNALYPWQIRQQPLSTVEPYSLVFMGTLGEENGSGLTIEALSIIVKKFPMTKLHIIGGPDHEIRRLQQLVNDLSLSSNVVLHGFIPSRRKSGILLRRCRVALAPYRAIPGSVRWYGDATKIRSYMAAGLPVITTHVPPLGKEIAAAGAGIITPDTPVGVAKGVIMIFQRRNLYISMRKASIAFAKQNTWEREFAMAFSSMDHA